LQNVRRSRIRCTRPRGLRAAALACLVLACGPASAGHDNIQVDPAFTRIAGQVVSLGNASPQGKIYSFTLKRLPPGPAFAPDELRGWRLTMLAGKRFSQAYEVVGNTGTELTVSSRGEPLDGVAPNDVFVIENTPLLPSSPAQQ
jgi:hypothetical protein